MLTGRAGFEQFRTGLLSRDSEMEILHTDFATTTTTHCAETTGLGCAKRELTDLDLVFIFAVFGFALDAIDLQEIIYCHT
jgi:hypothetical protein